LRRALQVKPGVSGAIRTPAIVSTMQILGFVLFGTGLVVHGMEQRISRRIEEKVRGQPDALTKTEIWLSTRRFTKRRKLTVLAEHSADATIREEAKKAMVLNTRSLVLAWSGLALMLAGSLS